MIHQLAGYYLSLHHWNTASVDSIRKMQVNKFRRIFEYASLNSKFYKTYYGDHGLSDFKIESHEDIKRVPVIDKSILRQYSLRDIMTRDLNSGINIHSTSGSTGEPFKIAFNKFEDYSAHVRVFWALRKAGYRITDKIVMVTRYDREDKFEIEKDVSTINRIQKRLHLFQREIISIYEPVDDIIAKLKTTNARILWSTPSIMQIVANRLKEMGTRLDFPVIFFTSENISETQKGLFVNFLGKNINNLYGSMESPSLGFDFGLTGKFTIFPNSNLFHIDKVTSLENGEEVGNVIITNLLNSTMPILRYNLNDLTEMDDHPDFGLKYLKSIIGRQDDIIKLSNGKSLAHHHAHEMFMDFHECEMFKFIQTPDQSVHLQLKIARGVEKSQVEQKALERWRKRFQDVPVSIEFIGEFKINPKTGKFKNIEKVKQNDQNR